MALSLHFRIYSAHARSILQTTHRLQFRNHRALTMVAHDWQRVESHADVPAYTLFTKPIEKSQLDEREYRLIKLENGLLAMLIQDAKADIAAASLDVAVGHLSDPVSVFLGASKSSCYVSAVWRMGYEEMLVLVSSLVRNDGDREPLLMKSFTG